MCVLACVVGGGGCVESITRNVDIGAPIRTFNEINEKEINFIVVHFFRFVYFAFWPLQMHLPNFKSKMNNMLLSFVYLNCIFSALFLAFKNRLSEFREVK